MVMTSSMTMRQAEPTDRPAVVELCRAALGWSSGGVDEQFFAWKHDENAFGPSPCWLAEEDGRLLGVRAFMRWRFHDLDGSIVEAVRAVDTATHPDAQGRGIFTKLTLGALPDLRAMGTDFVFNTPNEKSRPGYLKMGWGSVGRVPVAVRPTSPTSLQRMTGARVGASKWSEQSDVGMSAQEAFADEAEIRSALERDRPRTGIRTDHSPATLRWRYGFEPLRYRVFPLGDRLADGMIVFRVRRRGTATELTICDVVAPPGAKLRRSLVGLGRKTGADFTLVAGGAGWRDGFVPAPPLGPILTWKPLRRIGVPPMSDLSLTLGDVELF